MVLLIWNLIVLYACLKAVYILYRLAANSIANLFKRSAQARKVRQWKREAAAEQATAERIAAQAYQEARARAEAWERQRDAEMRRDMAAEQANAALRALGLQRMPRDFDELRKARNRMMLKVHPDVGGDSRLASRVTDAYNELLRHMTKSYAA